jgi:hypothetical protein
VAANAWRSTARGERRGEKRRGEKRREERTILVDDECIAVEYYTRRRDA